MPIGSRIIPQGDQLCNFFRNIRVNIVPGSDIL
jgi:hypothetical protein